MERLNAFRPDSLVGYASILRILAEEQLAGRLAVSPQAVMSASEVLTDETRERIRRAFGVPPTNVYAATETAGVASECRLGRLHRYEDLVITEIVDADNQPVPAGVQWRQAPRHGPLLADQPLIRTSCRTGWRLGRHLPRRPAVRAARRHRGAGRRRS